MNRSLLTTLRRRLVLAGVLLTVINVAVIAFHYVDWQGLRREKADEQVTRIAAALSRDPAGTVAVTLPPGLERMFREHPQAYAFRVEDARGRVLAEANAGLIPAGLTARDAPPSFLRATYVGEADGRPVAAMHRVALGDTDLFVVFASASDPARLTWGVFLDEIVGHVLVPLVPFALVLTLINLWTVRRSLASLTEAAAAADGIRASGGLEPLPTEGLPDEVRTLVEATNAALLRLGNALEAERAFTAEAAHALRTPLAVLAARLADLDGEGHREALRADVEAITRLVNQMLSAAQADTLVIDRGQRCDLTVVARDVVAAMAPLAIRAGRSLALDAEGPVLVRGDADALAHALRNLIENALRHAPAGSEIAVLVHASGNLEVLDRGPGIADVDKPHAARRFWRGAAATDGTGLGLPIAKRIAEAHGGDLVIADRPGGGAAIRLALAPALAQPRQGENRKKGAAQS